MALIKTRTGPEIRRKWIERQSFPTAFVWKWATVRRLCTCIGIHAEAENGTFTKLKMSSCILWAEKTVYGRVGLSQYGAPSPDSTS